ncbi:MAG TPA: hypothetical protein VL025_12505 [Thermoanaerobaculia bacterium]|nr:hypothetical protein [Thermoanaerobaculia bacterium]
MMPTSLRSLLVALCCLMPVGRAAVFAAQTPEPPRSGGGETIDVEIKIIPFYAVDGKGRPVHDLRPEEVELRIGGAPVPVDSFDRYTTAGGESGGMEQLSAPLPEARHVFLLFDAAFSTPRGFVGSRRVASGLLERLSPADRISVLINDTRIGFGRVLGPVSTDAQGKAQLLGAIDNLTPDIQRLDLRPDLDLGPPVLGSGKNGVPTAQVNHIYDFLRGSGRAEYASFAGDLAESLGLLAADLRRLAGPKLLVVFSQGLDPTLYFEGDSSIKLGSTESLQIDSRRQSPLLTQFQGPLQALADSGALAVFVNPDKVRVDADAALAHMAKSVGGLYLEEGNVRSLEKRIASSTAAYYEAGFHPTGPLLAAARAGVEVVIRRPGVKAWAPATVKTRETWEALSKYEKQMVVVDLIAGGPELQHARGPVRLDAQELAGRPLGRATPGRHTLRFQAAWPADVEGRKLDLYSVVLAAPEPKKPPRVLQLDVKEGAKVSSSDGIETTVESVDPFVWGFVAVEPGTGRAWFRRLMIHPDQARRSP